MVVPNDDTDQGSDAAVAAAASRGRIRHQRRLEERCRCGAVGAGVSSEHDAAGSLVGPVFRRAAAAPSSPAVAAVDGTLTYDQLTRHAAGVASTLAAAPRGHVGVLVGLERALPIALLGVLAAGRAAVPLDPRYPRRRLAAITAAEALAAIVAGAGQAGLAALLAPTAAVIELGDPLRGAPDSGVHRPVTVDDPAVDDPAVALLTSGSTGTPKRVVHSQRSIRCETREYGSKVGLGPRDRMLLVSSPSFADSLRTIWGALTHGAVLCPFDIARRGLVALADFIDGTGITVYRSVPSVLRELDGALPAPRRLTSVRLAYLAGEPVTASDVAICRRRFATDAVVVNGLGTSETLTFAWYLIGPDTPLEGAGVPVGWPLPGREVRLVDGAGGAVAPGEIGEIEVRTPSLAPSVGDPETPPSERAYRTGDLAVAAADGCLSHLGRTDFQVKIRGFRVNPVETEAALAAIANVDRAAVVGRSGRDGDLQLVAFVVAREPRPTVVELTRALHGLLPAHLVPARMELVDELPRTASGKVDRLALVETPLDERQGGGAGGTPRDAIESAVCMIWEAVLGLSGIGVEDRFLDLGGDSLRAIRIGARVLDTFDVGLRMVDLLASPTPADMAARIAAAMVSPTEGAHAD